MLYFEAGLRSAVAACVQNHAKMLWAGFNWSLDFAGNNAVLPCTGFSNHFVPPITKLNP